MLDLPIEIQLPEHFLEKEVRCGYEVSEKQKKIWAVELDLLKHLLDVCKKHNINVQVFAGTLLGAVRHRGMIPWDDDIDVAMTREDFKRLCEIVPGELSEPYFFQTALNDQKYFLPYARLRNSLTTGIVVGNESFDYNNGIFIDIFPLDGLPESNFRYQLQLGLMKVFVKCCTTYHMTERKNNTLVEIISRFLRPFIRCLPFHIWVRIYEKILSMWTNRTERIALRTHFQFGDKYNILKSELSDTIELPFENLLVPAPRAYDTVLSRIYGDYMSFPPPEQRGKWHEGQICFEPDMPYSQYLRQVTGS
jgi:lipopolysaccharide cholinephosphotransferase